jgi:endonuclease/exonuclease/phosphatase family metal-dependent hydrolase
MISKSRFSAILLASAVGFAGCEFDPALIDAVDQVRKAANVQQETRQAGNVRPTSTTLATPAPVRHSSETIKIASFNIQVFGTSKLKKSHVMDVLADVVRRYDIVAVQELRSTDQSVVPQFVQLINSEGASYDFVLGPRLGRTASKEQYVFIFDTSRIDVDRSSVYTVSDSSDQDLLHREPLVARFSVRGTGNRQPFSFTLVNIHTDPDETDIELDALDDVFVSVQKNGSGEDDVILLGDLNVDHRHLGELGELPNITWTVHGEKTNTRGTKSYDNIVFDGRHTNEFTGQAGVLDLMSEYGLSQQQAMEISDHMPVWAEFSIVEDSGAIVATRGGSNNR